MPSLHKRSKDALHICFALPSFRSLSNLPQRTNDAKILSATTLRHVCTRLDRLIAWEFPDPSFLPRRAIFCRCRCPPEPSPPCRLRGLPPGRPGSHLHHNLLTCPRETLPDRDIRLHRRGPLCHGGEDTPLSSTLGMCSRIPHVNHHLTLFLVYASVAGAHVPARTVPSPDGRRLIVWAARSGRLLRQSRASLPREVPGSHHGRDAQDCRRLQQHQGTVPLPMH